MSNAGCVRLLKARRAYHASSWPEQTLSAKTKQPRTHQKAVPSFVIMALYCLTAYSGGRCTTGEALPLNGRLAVAQLLTPSCTPISIVCLKKMDRYHSNRVLAQSALYILQPCTLINVVCTSQQVTLLPESSKSKHATLLINSERS